MKDWNLKALWDELKRTLGGEPEQEDRDQGEQADDPALLYHLMLTAPLLIGLLIMARR